MRRKIFTGVIAISLLVTQFVGLPIVFSDEISGEHSITQFEVESIQSTGNSRMNDMLNESMHSFTEDTEIEEISASVFEDDSINEKTIETTTEEITTSSSEIQVVGESIVDSSEEIRYEEVFYNKQTFKFPVQDMIDETEKNINDNHELSYLVESKKYITTEKQTKHPRWDFVSVSSHDGQLSIKEYETMKKEGITGVVVKLTEGTFYKNPFAKTQIENAQQVGLKVSTYHFSRYTTKQGAESEAAYYATEAKRLKLPENITMVNGLGKNLNEFSNQNAIFFVKKLNEMGFNQTIHYSSASSLDQNELSATILGEENLWVADYSNESQNSSLLHTENSAWQWSDKVIFTDIPGKEFDVGIDYSGIFSNATESIIEQAKPTEDATIITEKKVNKYGTVKSKNTIFWKDLDLENKNVNGEKYFQKTVYIEKEYTFGDETKVYLTKDQYDNYIGYVDVDSIGIAKGQEGLVHGYNKYVTLSENYSIWDGFSWQNQVSSSNYLNQTLEAKAIYYHFRGENYLSLYDYQGKWLGYINSRGATVANGREGREHSYNKYVTLSENYSIWDGFSWDNQVSSSNYLEQTLEARTINYHFSGERYLSLYTNRGKWLGYINSRGVKVANGQEGFVHSYNKYVKVSANYSIWDGFHWQNQVSSSNYLNQTLEAKAIYYHFSGEKYLSLYTDKGQWLGYINSRGIKSSTGQEGPAYSYDEYVTLLSNYSLWNNFNWEKKISSSEYQGRTVEAKAIYYHSSGERYLSIYDGQDNFLGYINQRGIKKVSSAQGDHQKYNKYVTIRSNKEPIYRNFNWTLQQTGNIGNETFQAKGVYHHFNGNRYFSIYDLNNKWIGYISETSVEEKATHLFVMGHGYGDPGAIGSGTNEREFTRIELYPYLTKYSKKLKKNAIVFYDTSKDMFQDTKNKQGLHNIYAGLSSITEFHLDAAGAGATGGHIIVHPNKTLYKEDLALADIIKKYNGLWGGVASNKGLSYRRDLLNLNTSYDYDVSYRLAELGFITNYKDVVKIRLNIDRIAKEFVEVVTGEKL
ncbi:GH25 family lysozyme [Enterococcus sp.]|uniref:GH25 family lysozyme n=1 Tax=Enterococcus sp. TaxID=35783 RepID=UPI002FC721EC